MAKNKRSFIVVSVLVPIIIMVFIVISATIMNMVKYPNNNSPTCNVNENTIVVICNQKDRIRFKKSSIKYRIKENGDEYGEWQDSNQFTNLTENEYYIQTSIVDSNNKYSVSIPQLVHMYNGQLMKIEGKEVSTEKGGLYTIPYYEFKQSKSITTKKCPNSGKRAGVWGDTDLTTCSLCGAKNVATRTEEKVKYKTWNGYDAYRNVYVYTNHNIANTIYDYFYTYNKDEGEGKIINTYYAKNRD